MKIIFEFVGGPNDGKVVQGKLGEPSDAERYYMFSNHGAVGQRFKVVSQYAVETLAEEELKVDKGHHFQPHYYVVTDRLEENDEVLVRAEYVEKEAEKSSKALVKEYLEPSLGETESADEKIQQFLELAAKSMAESYSHYWPVDQERNLALHFGHILLNENFSVFAKSNHQSEEGREIDMVGISPNQDWFLACEFMQLHDTETLRELLDSLQRLATFWLNSELTIPACAENIARVAEHCQTGFGVVVGLHWVPEGTDGTNLIKLWKTQIVDDNLLQECSKKLAELDARFSETISIQTFAGLGTYYLLGAYFQIPR